jgi:dUTP pyrophosphatase
MKEVEIKYCDPRSRERGSPTYATQGAGGIDLRSCDNAMIYPGETVRFPTGYSIYMKDPSLCAFIMPRSSMGIKGILPANVLGLIDSDYQGEMVVYLKNHSNESYLVSNGDRIAQLVFLNVQDIVFKPVTEFSETTERGEGGFGSTGKGWGEV